MLSDYQRGLRDRFLAADVSPPPDPWRPAGSGPVAVGGLLGVGFAPDPVTGRDLVLVASNSGLGVLDAATGERLARDGDEDLGYPDGPDLSCPGIGPLEGTRVRVAGLFGGGLHATSGDGWSVDVVSPDWPHDRVLLSTHGGPWRGEPGEHWWHIAHIDVTELRAAGFSPSGRTLAVATSADLTLFART